MARKDLTEIVVLVRDKVRVENFKHILPQQLLDHTERLCPLTVIDCDYVALGCAIKVRDLFGLVCFGQFCLFYFYFFLNNVRLLANLLLG